MAAAGRVAELCGSLLDPAWLRAKLAATDVIALTTDFDRLPEDEASCLLQGALRLSAHVIGKDPKQFSSQMVGRLLSYRDMPTIARFTARVAEGTGIPWLRPLHVALYQSGSALVRTLEGHTASVLGVALSRDGRRAVSASDDHTLKVWEVESGRKLRTLEGHMAAVRGVALSGDGRLAVSASGDKTLKVWDLGSGRELRTLEGHTAAVRGVALSGDGRRAVSASWDKTLKVWEVERGVPLATFTCDSAAYSCAFSEALKLVGGDALGRVHFLELVESKVNS